MLRREPHFAVTMCLFPRRLDPFYHLAEMSSILSLAQQDYPHWTLVVGGDGLDNRQLSLVRDMLNRSDIPNDRWLLVNTLRSMSERQSDFGFIKEPKLLWFNGGTGCSNHVHEYVARELPHCTHIAHIDDDDLWKENHLSLHARAYMDVPDTGYAFSMALCYPKGLKPPLKWLSHFPLWANNTAYRVFPPLPCYMIPTIVTWRVGHPGVSKVKGHLYHDQYHWARQNVSEKWDRYSPFQRCPYYQEGLVINMMAGDMDYFDRLTDEFLAGNLVSVSIANVTATHTSTAYKKSYLSLLRQSYCTPSKLAGHKRWSKTTFFNSSFTHRIIDGRSQRMSRLLLTDGESGRHSAQASDSTWSPSRVLEHHDYAPSLDAYRAVKNWMLVSPPSGDDHSEHGEMLHIIRPLIDIACDATEHCVYAEFGDYCGISLGLALSSPRLTHAVNLGNARLDNRSCHDLLMSSFRRDDSEEHGDRTVARQDNIYRRRNYLPYFLDTRDVQKTYGRALEQRLHCLHQAATFQFYHRNFLQDLTTQTRDMLPAGKANFLLMRPSPSNKSSNEAAEDLICQFQAMSQFVEVGGIVAFDQHTTSAVVRKAIHGWWRVSSHGHNTKFHAIHWGFCKTEYICFGPVANFGACSLSTCTRAMSRICIPPLADPLPSSCHSASAPRGAPRRRDATREGEGPHRDLHLRSQPQDHPQLQLAVPHAARQAVAGHPNGGTAARLLRQPGSGNGPSGKIARAPPQGMGLTLKVVVQTHSGFTVAYCCRWYVVVGTSCEERVISRPAPSVM